MAAQLNPATREAANDAEKIVANFSKWDENFIAYLNKKGWQMKHIQELLKPGSASRQYLEQNIPQNMLKKGEEVVNFLAKKQGEARPASPDKASSSTRERYKILPINK